MSPTKKKNTKECTIIDLRSTSQGKDKNLNGPVANSKGGNAQQGNPESKKTKKGNDVTRKHQKGKDVTRKLQKVKDEPRKIKQSTAKPRKLQQITAEPKKLQKGKAKQKKLQKGKAKQKKIQKGKAKQKKVQKGKTVRKNTKKEKDASRKTKKGRVVNRRHQKVMTEPRRSQERTAEQRKCQERTAEQRKCQERTAEQRRSQERIAEQRIIEEIIFEENDFGESHIPLRVIHSYYVNISICSCDNTTFNYRQAVKIVDITEQGSTRYIVKVMGTVICYSNERYIFNRAIAMKVKKVYTIEYHVTRKFLRDLLNSSNNEERLGRRRNECAIVSDLVKHYGRVYGINFSNIILLDNTVNRVRKRINYFLQRETLTETHYYRIKSYLIKEITVLYDFCQKIDLVMALCKYLNVIPHARGVRFYVDLSVSKKLLLNREQYSPVIAMVNMLLEDALNRINFNFYSDSS